MAFLTLAKATVVAPPFVPREQVTIVSATICFPQNVLKNKNGNGNQYKAKKAPLRGGA